MVKRKASEEASESKQKAEEGSQTKKKKKTKSVSNDEEEEEEVAAGVPPKSYAERCEALTAIADPLADEKLTKKLYKLVRRASAAKVLRRGVKEVVKAIRKGASGLCLIAGDVAPIDVICHLPVFCEEKAVPYIYVPSKQDLGFSALTKRPTSCVLVAPKKGAAFEHQELLDKALAKITKQATAA